METRYEILTLYWGHSPQQSSHSPLIFYSLGLPMYLSQGLLYFIKRLHNSVGQNTWAAPLTLYIVAITVTLPL